MLHSRFSITILTMAASFAVNIAFAQDAAVAEGRQESQAIAQQGLASLYDASPGTKSAIEHAAGYGVFSTVGVKLLFAGGTRGKGVVVNNRTHSETFMKMLQVQGGLGFGVSRNSVIFLFQTESALRAFVDEGWEFSGQGTLAAAASDEGGSLAGAVSVSPGVFVYQITDTGLAATLTVAGTKFFKDDELN
jgi:lipid-binding SYLF domain-containing protein